ncbi:HAMP domain-containing histidine kinase [Algoriphagus aestuariicola]|uniref:histidine kinase n=1 Tax=Algoriphagus aestuariicola TaxID=1852016 RepID=A0ABS3BQF2_9BACT|nr:HAMP domain-containing sensor histidine kinase [Algoriphagus aestuariicola]MBN7801049.1 HAMP domain-containing histidine kinase [Algoriphagus aestuariicola]
MKLLNQSLKYLSVSILLILGLWAVVFYFNMLREIKESVDEGLENYKRQIIRNAAEDSSLLAKRDFDEGLFTISEMSKREALEAKDSYLDTLLYMQDRDDEVPELEPVRMLVTAFELDGRYYELKMINPMVEEDDLVKELFLEAIWLYLILLIAIVFVNNLVLQRLWRPFYDFLEQLKNYRIGKSKVQPKAETQIKEFKDLQTAVKTLLQHAIESYEQQNQFIGNASHELQTPLAIATNKLELLIENGTLESGQAESVAEVLNIIGRMVRLNKSLLLLSKIENRQFLDNQTVSLNEIARQAAGDMEEIADFKGVQIVLESQDDILVDMDPSLAITVISNLLRNAVFHNIEGGLVKIELRESRIKISNTGQVESLDGQHIFDRFYKSDSSQAGTGLGLAIVKAICILYGFEISYRMEGGLHCFEIDFRKS